MRNKQTSQWRKSPQETDNFTDEVYKLLQKESVPILELFQKGRLGGTLPNTFYEADVTLTPKPKGPQESRMNSDDINIPRKVLASLSWLQGRTMAWEAGLPWQLKGSIRATERRTTQSRCSTSSGQHPPLTALLKFRCRQGKVFNMRVIYESSTADIIHVEGQLSPKMSQKAECCSNCLHLGPAEATGKKQKSKAFPSESKTPSNHRRHDVVTQTLRLHRNQKKVWDLYGATKHSKQLEQGWRHHMSWYKIRPQSHSNDISTILT